MPSLLCSAYLNYKEGYFFQISTTGRDNGVVFSNRKFYNKVSK